MEIFKAIVEPYLPGNALDPSIINAVLVPGQITIKVRYTSPNHQRYFYGLYAPPAVGSEILVAYEKDLSEYYYLNTIVNHSLNLGSISKDSNGNPAPLYSEYKMTDDRGNPAAMFFKNEKDAGLKISNYYASGDPIINSVELKSSKGSKVILSDSPGAECVVLRNSEGDSITIGGDVTVPYRPTGDSIPRGITINSLNSQQCIVSNGEFKVSITDGRDISLKNDSVGTYGRLYVPNPIEPPVGWLGPLDPFHLFGNVNLSSKWRDINIFTEDTPVPYPSRTGSIYLSTRWGFIQLVGGQGVKIFNTNPLFKVSIQSAGSVDVVSQTGSINLVAPAGDVNISARTINMQATTTLNAEGLASTNIGSSSPLNLNSGVPIIIPPTALTGLAEIPTPNVFGK